MPSDNVLGERIREERKKLGLTLEELAKKLNVSGKSVISNYETGYSKPDLDTLSKLADIFGATTDYLLGRNDRPHSEKVDEIMQDMTMAANMDGERGEKPSPELIALVRGVVEELLEEKAKKK